MRVAALGIFDKRREEIDLVILDMVMPVMDGPHCLAAIKATDPGICVVICTDRDRIVEIVDR